MFRWGRSSCPRNIVTINQDKLRELGVKWSAPSGDMESGLYQTTTVSSELAVKAPTTTVGFNIGRINGRMLELELSALEQQQQLEIIASPRLLVAHQQSASIKQGTEIPYQVSNGKNEATSVEFKEAVLGMEVTPTLSHHGVIRLKLRISQNMPGRSIQHADGEALAIDKQEIETQVEVKDGETLALGGIFQQQNNHTRDKRSFAGKYSFYRPIVSPRREKAPTSGISRVHHTQTDCVALAGFFFSLRVFLPNSAQVFDGREELAYKVYRFGRQGI
ncbi:Type IV pilus biogenesis and competence protein pilQ precursor [Cedecea neteri]|uniref:Type IV pilus biogenesis and competence protein pilQ n=1 Tax=Cedecea neteri TaxID=158822 RepID=A0A2X2TAI2_9ENTR|nr:Type IV pilus biogenesis and competence protein pilQ precursor [Cedecea neteri]